MFNRIAEKHCFSPINLDQVESLRHHGTREMMRYVKMPAWKLPLASRSVIDLMKEHAADLSLFDGVDQALRFLTRAGVQLAVVSSNSEHNVRQVLGRELNQLIGQFKCGMSIFGKASRIRSVLMESGVPAHEAIYIADQGTEAEAAHKVNVAFGAVTRGYASIKALRRHAPKEEFDCPASLVRIAGHDLVGSAQTCTVVQITAWATITRSPLKVAAGEPYSR